MGELSDMKTSANRNSTSKSKRRHNKNKKSNTSRESRLAKRERDVEDPESDDEEEVDDDEDDDYLTPGAISVPGIGRNHQATTTTTTTTQSKSSSDLVVTEANLVSDSVCAETVDVREQEQGIVKKRRLRGILIAACVFHAFAICFYIVGITINLVYNNIPTYTLTYAQAFGYAPADGVLLIATVLYSVSMCVSSSSEPAKGRILRIGLGASIGATVLLLAAIILMWHFRTRVGFAVMAISFSVTLVAFYCGVVFLRTRPAQGRAARLFYRTLMVVAILFILFLLSYGTWNYETWVPFDDYPDCHYDYELMIGSGFCDAWYDLAVAAEECGFDGGDCRLTGEECATFKDCASAICNPETNICE